VRVGLAIACGFAAGLLQFGARVLLQTYALVGTGDANAGYAALAVLIAALLTVTLALGIVQLAVLTGRPGKVVPTGVALVVLGACAALLGPVTFFISVAIFAAACLYAVAAAADGRRIADAIAESCRIALSAPGPTVAALATLAAGAILGAIAGGLLASVAPLAGDLAAGLLGQFAVAYAGPRILATYLKLQPGAAGQ
jgi:hypothetical protein